MFRNFSFLLCVVILAAEGKNEDYKGFKIYKVKFVNQEQQDRFQELKTDAIDYLRKPILKYDVTGRALVPPSHLNWFEEKLQELGIDIDVAVSDVYEYLKNVERKSHRNVRNDESEEDVTSEDISPEIDESSESPESSEPPESSESSESSEAIESVEEEIVFDFRGYYRYDVILNHLRAIVESYATSTTIRVALEQFGVTDENRPIYYFKISQDSTDSVQKPVVIVEAGINPREWITIPAALNVVNRILDNQYQFLDKADWIVIPVLNPDGYEYTHTNLRLWSKNLSQRSNLGFICPGANINRNFHMGWQLFDSSTTPCSHLFSGTEPYSEPETQALRSLIQEYGSRTRLYFSLQNNDGFISYPWQYERAASGMFRQHHLLGLEMIAATNEAYRLDIGWEALGDRISGTSSDFVQDSGILYSFNIDIVQRGEDGVSVPVDEIADVIEDAWRAMAVAGNALL